MSWRNAALILVLAVAVRALALWDDGDALLYQVGGLDAPQYLDMAQRFVAGEWPDEKPFFWAPGYSFLLGLLSAISPSITWLKAVQVVLGAVSCLLVGVLASRLFQDVRVAVLAALGAALYGPLVYYDLQISPATLDVSLTLSLLVVLLEARARNRLWLWLAAGLLAAASAITRGAVLLMLPFVAAWLLWPPPPLDRTRAAQLAAWLAPVCIALALVAQHNIEGDRAWGGSSADTEASAEHSPTGGLFLSYNLGINFLLGNVQQQHALNRVEHPLCLLNYKELVFKPTLGSAQKPSQQSRFLMDEALTWMRAHPLEWLQLTGVKALELVHGEEISRDTSIDASGVDNRVLDALFWKHGVAFPSGVLIPLALLGIAYAPKRSRAHALVLGALAAQAIFVVAFFVTTRYRLALWVTAMPYAAYALVAAFDALRARPTPALLGTAALVLLLVLSNHGVSPEPTAHLAFEHEHLGSLLDEAGKHDEAAAQWRLALERDPGFAQAHFELAVHHVRRREADAAASHYEAGIQAAPTSFAARIAYASLLIKQNRLPEATDQLRRALQGGVAPRVHVAACMMAVRAKLDLRPYCKKG